MDANWDATKGYLTEYPVLLCEEAANFLALWCIDLELEEVKYFSNLIYICYASVGATIILKFLIFA